MQPKLPVYCRADVFDRLVEVSASLESTASLLPAAITVSRQAIPDAKVGDISAELDAIAGAVGREVRGAQVQAWYAHLHEHLFVEMGFSGNSSDYYNPSNSLLPAVLRTRTGLPITLSLLYKLVADRLGLSAWGVGLPGHFLAGIELNGRPALVDTFAGGNLLSMDEARNRVRKQFGDEYEWSEDMVDPVSNRYWVTRILQNLLTSYSQLEHYRDVAAVLEMEVVLWPGETRLQRDMALVLARVGRSKIANEWLDLYLENHPDDPQGLNLRQLIARA